jgi:hypothetical protein
MTPHAAIDSRTTHDAKRSSPSFLLLLQPTITQQIMRARTHTHTLALPCLSISCSPSLGIPSLNHPQHGRGRESIVGASIVHTCGCLRSRQSPIRIERWGQTRGRCPTQHPCDEAPQQGRCWGVEAPQATPQAGPSCIATQARTNKEGMRDTHAHTHDTLDTHDTHDTRTHTTHRRHAQTPRTHAHTCIHTGRQREHAGEHGAARSREE